MKTLVSICDFGGRPTLESVKKCFDYENFTTRIFSTVDGDFVYPPSIGEDLPFQHRELFAKEIDKYDFFIFTENDIFYPKETIEFVLKNNNIFGEDLPIGLIREEEGHFIDFGALMHAPRKAIKINEDYFYCPNDHQASYFLTKNQLKLFA